MAKNPHLTQDKLDLLAQIPEEVIELISSCIKNQADLAAMFHGLKSRVIESALAGEMDYHLSSRATSEVPRVDPDPSNCHNGFWF